MYGAGTPSLCLSAKGGSASGGNKERGYKGGEVDALV